MDCDTLVGLGLNPARVTATTVTTFLYCGDPLA